MENRKNSRKEQNPGITSLDFWEEGFENEPWFNDIEKILEIPDITDFAGILARGNFDNKRQLVAVVRLAYRHRKYNDTKHQHMLRDFIAALTGMKAFGKLLQLQIGTRLGMPTVLREALGMKAVKPEKEQVYRGSDFRIKDTSQQPNDIGDIK